MEKKKNERKETRMFGNWLLFFLFLIYISPKDKQTSLKLSELAIRQEGGRI